MNKKFLYYDLETTGLTKEHGIVEIGGLIDIDGEIIETFNFKVKPFEDDLIDEKALEVTNLTREEIETFEDPLVVKDKLLEIFDKYINKFKKSDKFITFGFNNRVFDFPMLINWFNKCDEKYLGSYISYKQKFDTLAFLENMRIMKLLPHSTNTKLGEVCEEYGVDLKNAHSALDDIIATRELTYKLARLVKKNLKGDVF